jgi:hypothetical protein
MAGTISVTSREWIEISSSAVSQRVEKVVIDWVGDAADASVPALSVPLKGFLIQAITNPGATAPTDNYDIQITNSEGASISGTNLDNRDTANSEAVIFSAPPLCDGDMSLAVTNNSVNSATGRIVLYLSSNR